MMVLSSLALRLWWRMWVRCAMSIIAAAPGLFEIATWVW
jgi:hypothetical protein